MDLDTIIYESLCTRSNSTLDFSCAPSHDSACGFNSSLFTILAATSHLAPSHFIIYQPTEAISCHVTECCSVIGLHSTVRRNSWLYKVTPQTPSLPCRNRVWPCETNNNQCFLLWCMLTIFPVCVCFHFVLTFVISSHVYPGMMLHITVTQKQKWKTDWLTGQWEGYGSTLVT